jgi:phosphoribosylglycinamide formyltransferase-1
VKLTGCTAHFVSEQMDSGPVIIQAATALNSNDSMEELEARIHRLEHRIYPQALQWLAQGRIRVSGRRVEVLPGKSAAIAAEDGCLINPPLEEGF